MAKHSLRCTVLAVSSLVLVAAFLVAEAGGKSLDQVEYDIELLLDDKQNKESTKKANDSGQTEAQERQIKENGKREKCTNDDSYISPQGLACKSYSMLSCRGLGAIGFSEYEVNELLTKCPESCDISCNQRRKSVSDELSQFTQRRQQEDEATAIGCKNEDSTTYRSPQGTTCQHYRGWDCRLFQYIGFSEFEVYDLVNSCPASCFVPCGTFTLAPSMSPSLAPTVSSNPSVTPSIQPTGRPSTNPSQQPTSSPSTMPTDVPSSSPSARPSSQPSGIPSLDPSVSPSMSPSSSPSQQPSHAPSTAPSDQPSSVPSSAPTHEEFILSKQMQALKAEYSIHQESIKRIMDERKQMRDRIVDLKTENQSLMSYRQTIEDSNKIFQFLQQIQLDSLEICTSTLATVDHDCDKKNSEIETNFIIMQKLHLELWNKQMDMASNRSVSESVAAAVSAAP